MFKYIKQLLIIFTVLTAYTVSDTLKISIGYDVPRILEFVLSLPLIFMLLDYLSIKDKN